MTERKRVGEIDAKLDELWAALIRTANTSPPASFNPHWDHINTNLYRPVRSLCRDDILFSVNLHIRQSMLDRP